MKLWEKLFGKSISTSEPSAEGALSSMAKRDEGLHERKRKAQIQAEREEKAARIEAMKEQARGLRSGGPEFDEVFGSLFADLEDDDPDVRAEASRLLADAGGALQKVICVYHERLNSDPRLSSLAGRVLGRKVAQVSDDMIPVQIAEKLYGLSVSFIPCSCVHCGHMNKGIAAPPGGPNVGYSHQSDDRGAYAVPVLCDRCGKDFFVVWDADPRALTEKRIVGVRREATPESRAQAVLGSIKSHLLSMHQHFKLSQEYGASAPYWRSLESPDVLDWLVKCFTDSEGKTGVVTETTPGAQGLLLCSVIDLVKPEQIRAAFAPWGYLDYLEKRGFFDAPHKRIPAVAFLLGHEGFSVRVDLFWLPPIDGNSYQVVIAQDLLTAEEKKDIGMW